MLNIKNIRCYDNGGKTYDRYTVVYMDSPAHWQPDGIFQCIGASDDPFHYLGFGQHSTAMPGRHLGKRVEFASLPAGVQKMVRQDYEEEEEGAETT